MTEPAPAPAGALSERAGSGSPAVHPRTIGWVGTTALAMGGSNQSLFLIAGAGGLIASQGSAAVPLLILGLLLSWAALPGWIELVLMWPNRVGGIAATCAEAFRPISPVLAGLTGVCYWWGWVPTCGLTAILSATAIHTWYFPEVPIAPLATGLVLFFTGVNLCGIRWVTRLAVPLASASALLAFLSGLVPILAGQVNWQQATTFHLITPFPGAFGAATSAMAGLYIIGFAAPAFEQAACHVGETVDPVRNVPRAMLASAGMATVYFALLPVVWLGVLGTNPLTKNLQDVLDPTFAPLLGITAHAAALWFMMFNMFHGTLAPLAGAARTLSQLAEDGLLPRILAWRTRTDMPGVATGVTAALAILFLLIGDPIWIVAAANLCYLIGICLPSVAVWLLRRSAPGRPRPYRAPTGLVEVGVVAAAAWGISAVLGFQQYGLPTVLGGIALASSGAILYAIRIRQDRPDRRRRRLGFSLHMKLTGAMLLVLAFDGAGYLLAVENVRSGQPELRALLEDIFVIVALLTISVGLVLPGIIGHAAQSVAAAADRLATGTLTDFSRAMHALATGDLDAAHARADFVPLDIHSRDEMGALAASFDLMQRQVARAAAGLDGAREGLRESRDDLRASNAQLARQVQAMQESEEKLRDSEERFRQVAEHVQEVFWMAESGSRRILYISPTFDEIWGRPRTDLYVSAEPWIATVHPADRARVRNAQATKQVRGDYDEEYRIVRPDGSLRWIHDRAFPIRDATGAVYRLVGIAEDITERRQSEAAVQLSEARYRAIVEDQTELIGRFLPGGTMTFVNEAFCRYFGWERAALLGRPFFQILGPSAQEGLERVMAGLTAGQPLSVHEHCFVSADRGTGWLQWTVRAIFDESERLAEFQAVGLDITERKQVEEQLHYQANHDTLTGLPNRSLFFDRLEQALAHSSGVAQPLAVLFLDLDRFKIINDSLGHGPGDQLLVAVAARLAACVRRADITARLGGDEFTILLEAPSGVEEVTGIAERILAALQAPFDLGGQDIFITTSIGIVFRDAASQRPADLLRNADVALYEAKRKGKARYAIYDASMNAHALDQLEMEGQLQRALERGEFEVYYQPKVVLATGRLAGMEALVRWRHPQRGLVPPADFIPLAEETGLIRPLGQWVLQEACRQARAWHERAPDADPLVMSVNLSAREFQHPDLVENVAQALRATGIDPRGLQLEITESVVMEDAAAAGATLANLKRLGVGLAIDDFGTGYSSLSYLKRFPVDALKIDRTFVTGLGADAENTAIVQAVISLGRALKLTVVAEGVESAADARQLCALGCELGQGYYFGLPVPHPVATEWVLGRLPAAVGMLLQVIGSVPADRPGSG